MSTGTATKKYVDPLLAVFGGRLLFKPRARCGGDMSRSGLFVRAADAKTELCCEPIATAVRHGARPSKLPLRRASRVSG